YGFLEMLKTSISLAVAAVPEGLPTVATTTLALGIVNMRKHHVLIRRLDVVETLGCVQTICLVKTGTLTLNRMSALPAYLGMRRIQIVDGQFFLGGEPLEPVRCEELLRLAQVCALCSETEIEQHAGQYAVRGSPTENALVQLAISAGVDVPALRAERPLLTMQMRSENQNFMRTVHGFKRGEIGESPESLLTAVKGSPREVLLMGAWQFKEGQRLPLTEEDRLGIEAANDRMAGEALRVLGGAYGYVEDQGKDTATLDGLTWLGLIGMADPI